jgi:hypothetical protein
MPGFVDVSHMSNEEVRRMGHADDYDEDTNRRSYRNPYAYRKPTAPKENISFTADDMWAAAWQAYAINGNQYVKALLPGVPEDQPQPNRAIAERLLANPEQITEESRQVGGVMRRYFQGLTFKLIEGKKLTPFLQSAFDAANKDEITSKYDLAVIVSLPATYEKSVKREDIDRKINWAQGGYIGIVGVKTEQRIEIIRKIWSQKWNTWFYSGINDQDQVLFFAHMKTQLDVGSHVTIQGVVKAHRDNSTQLNRVKVIE